MAQKRKTSPSRAWFVLPTLLLLTAGFLGAIGISSFLHFFRADFVAYQPGSAVSIPSEGLTLYAGESTGSADGTIGRPQLHCEASGPSRQVRLPLAGQLTVSNGQGRFEAVASTPQGLPAGRYAISCTSTSGTTDLALYLGPRLDVGQVGRVVVFNIVTPVFLGFCSMVLFGVLAFLRYRSRQNASASD